MELWGPYKLVTGVIALLIPSQLVFFFVVFCFFVSFLFFHTFHFEKKQMSNLWKSSIFPQSFRGNKFSNKTKKTLFEVSPKTCFSIVLPTGISLFAHQHPTSSHPNQNKPLTPDDSCWTGSNSSATFKTLLTFHYTGWLNRDPSNGLL